MPHPRVDDGDVPRAAHFDPELDAWVLSTHADVFAALRAHALRVQGATAEGEQSGDTVRDIFARKYTAEQIDAWRDTIEVDAVSMVGALPQNEPVDLVGAFAEPWSLGLALLATDASAGDAHLLARLARTLFLAAASATDGAPPAAAQDAARELTRRLAPGHAASQTSANVQAFVALSQTLPALLAGAWHTIMSDAALQATLREQAHLAGRLSARALNELLRVAGPARAVFRESREDVAIGEVRLRAGDRVVANLRSANLDADQFPDPSRVDLKRERAGHLAFGAGAHACVGASLVREALDAATTALLGGTSSVELDTAVPVRWIEGFAIRSPGTLRVVITR